MGKLLLVDDDQMILKLYKRYFEKHFEVTTATSAEEALNLIRNKKYNPEVILSGQVMPGISGSEFLSIISNSHPNSIRILMTANSEPSKIIPIVNQAKAFMFLIKPIKEIDLVQSINLAFKHYKLQLENQLLIKKLKEQNIKLTNELTSSNAGNLNTMFEIILGLKVFKGNYFYNHFEGVVKLSNYFITELKLPASYKNTLLKITLYYELMNLTFPSRLAYTNPFTLEEQDKLNYIRYFTTFIEKVSNFTPFPVFEQIWEHADGSGIPNGLKIDKISLESQIFQISNLYFHILYELPNKDLVSKFTQKNFKYRYENAFDKMKKAQKYILENMKWFNDDLINVFRFAIKENKIDVFLPVRENMEIENNDYLPEFEAFLKELEEYKEKEQNAPEIVHEGDNSYIIKNLPPHQLAIGMIINQNIVTTQNVPVAKPGTKITGNLLENIHNLYEKKKLKNAETIEVKIPV